MLVNKEDIKDFLKLVRQTELFFSDDIVIFGEIQFPNKLVSGFRVCSGNVHSLCDTVNSFTIKKGEMRVDKDFVVSYSNPKGSNVATFRRWRKGVSEERKQKVLQAIKSSDPEAMSLYRNATSSISKDIMDSLKHLES